MGYTKESSITIKAETKTFSNMHAFKDQVLDPWVDMVMSFKSA